MARYAARTKVPVYQTRLEIERLVTRYKADGFMSGWGNGKATIQFKLAKRFIRFSMKADPEREDRQAWRALLLVIKAKLEAVDAGILTFEESFFSHIVMPDGRTVYETAREPVALAYDKGVTVPLLESCS